MIAKTVEQIEGLQRAGKAVRDAFQTMVSQTQVGITTKQLDDIGAAVLARHGAVSAPQMYYDFPGATCISVNEEAAHGIPGSRVIAEGDMVNIDVSANLAGYVADMGQSFVVGQADDECQRICDAVKLSVDRAIAQVRSGRSLNVIGQAVQQIADQYGYTIVRNLGSHGVGESIHEEPSYIPYDNPDEDRILQAGMVFTIEPFFSTGIDWVYEEDDGWTLSVPPGNLVAQYEHTLIVNDDGATIVTQ